MAPIIPALFYSSETKKPKKFLISVSLAIVDTKRRKNTDNLKKCRHIEN